MLSAFIAGGVEFLIVGAYALAAHGVPRATGDLDFWVRPSDENARRVLQALDVFGAPLHDLSAEDLTQPDLVYQIGVEPVRIDILTEIDGVAFDEAWAGRVVSEIDGLRVPVIGRAELIRNKRALGRTKDLADIEALEHG
jgi:hypothetical protein